MMEILIVSHSEAIAKGVKALLEQMAQDVVVKVTGGINGEIGTSIDDIMQMFDSVEGEALCFYDIGSSKMNIEMALEMKNYSNIHIAHYPIVEGAFLASVESKIGKGYKEILESLSNNFKEK
ncbi:PTS-dependent dihydroxyacetone kinase phosphotransferase subunit DhaM [Macrococcoides caseolyticum subsp. caseolyticum]|nr:dihydroxyacetone kinase phosphoryl donor subunit DhaM [Macrococcus caseolyticus]MDJ1089065.1 dihydroxyacetone kinase phosphoryl donor subunit DhaM [Macrococcus caseolyticus]MDJ1110203.1 dihydroxyacetone kinase phosphoryl donor subunit DhaM [Macrococcus caseolyticus]MDJ1153197.1 dihydroxyacetone kinase phosphoryl donor subunit DhaM [Macrococcus caseolyticus]MEB8171540.1 dihydroxyacetone kinase phosphoryl donor subunit DhaM [Macrococcus caseolyticus]PNZ74466.1 PTS-dependent dihydroxyacetone k